MVFILHTALSSAVFATPTVVSSSYRRHWKFYPSNAIAFRLNIFQKPYNYDRESSAHVCEFDPTSSKSRSPLLDPENAASCEANDERSDPSELNSSSDCGARRSTLPEESVRELLPLTPLKLYWVLDEEIPLRELEPRIGR